MCKIAIVICSKCDNTIDTKFELCDRGKNGYLCVGPETPSNRPFLTLSNDPITGKEYADVVTISPSIVSKTTCQPCSRTSSRR